VETKEPPLSKVVVPMPQVTVAIEEQEHVAKFEVCIMNAVNLLVFHYDIADYNAYQGLRHG
jgi:hypothetical protein